MELFKRRKAYAITFLTSGLAIGGVGILSVWAPDLISGTLAKVLLSLLVALATSATLFMVSFGTEEDKVTSKMSLLIGACTVLIAGILLAEIWLDVLESFMMGKLIFTLLIICGLAGFVVSVWDDFFENKRLKDENYLD